METVFANVDETRERRCYSCNIGCLETSALNFEAWLEFFTCDRSGGN